APLSFAGLRFAAASFRDNIPARHRPSGASEATTGGPGTM
ncbi:MAG: hypothetical protein AVDCRST_MAG93-1667, partial [uncultured Chloroflexia bacterium]